MTVLEILTEAVRLGLKLTPTVRGLRLEGRRDSPCPPALRQAIQDHLWGVMAVLTRRREGACAACGACCFWISVHDAVVCGVCHPPAQAGVVLEWLELGLPQPGEEQERTPSG